MNKKSVSIVIPNYNGRKLLEDFLPYTIQAIRNAEVDYEIIIIDDASKDSSIAFLEANYPEIIILKNEVNKGFSVACNVGIAKALKELILILNSDIKLSANYFDNQWQCFVNEDTFGVMGRIVENSTNTYDGPRLPKKVGFKYRQNLIYTVENEQIPVPTIFISGANALVCAKKIKQIGGFDEIFSPFYYEDTDLSLRAWRLGWKCYYDFQSTCFHLGSSTINANNLKKSIKFVFYRNRFILHGIHLTKNQFKWFKLQILFLEIIPKILIGRFWILKSFSVLKKYEIAINNSKEKLAQQAIITGKILPIFSLKNEILSQLKLSKTTFYK